MKPLSLNSPADDETSSEKSETAVGELANEVRLEYGSGNVFEGKVSKYIPHGTGRLFLRDGGITYQVLNDFVSIFPARRADRWKTRF